MRYIYITFFISLVFTLVFCTNDNTTNNEDEINQENLVSPNTFLNLDEAVGYVGMDQCRSCHQDVYETYIHTGMGQSFHKATPQKSKASFGKHAVVYDEANDYYYKPYFVGEELYIKEYRLKGKDTVHQRTEKIAYIIGSGQHTNSHLINKNGYVYQAPITFYTQEKRWDLAPGFEEKNERFSRLIATECLTCHNHFPKHTKGSENKYKEMPLGIECERCHGPGELHVQEKLAGNLVDTSQYTDYTIVNPRNLSIELQMDLCQRCHLQGVSVLKEGKDFYDFRPGMALSDVMDVYLPRFSNSHERFIMASQADRLRLSDCYKSGQLSCINCHNPHHSVESTDQNQYNSSCKSCHTPKNDLTKINNCRLTEAERMTKNNDCVSCHMPPSGSIDIPHINITDHYISKSTAVGIQGKPISEKEKEDIARFLGLQNLTNPKASSLDMARGYLALYDKFMQDPVVLDSIAYYISRASSSDPQYFETQVHYWFVTKNYNIIARSSASKAPKSLNDAWTAYRIGQAFSSLKDLGRAVSFLERAVELSKYNLDFQEKLGVAYAKMRKHEQAKTCFEFVLKENPDRKLALANLGFMYALRNDINKAMDYYNRALALDPDYITALLNKAGAHLQQKQLAEANTLLKRVLEIQPNHQRAKTILKQINR
ncbi:MAG: tetratricopeptide repeat protein [Saprospiraceae bacterium]|nr:tetratricopeptide repeat protein [Saprospiraceae bacterium]